MKRKVFCRSYTVTLVVGIFVAAVFSAWGNSGGGKGDALSPYLFDNEVTLKRIEEIRNQASKSRAATGIRVKDSLVHLSGENVGFIYLTKQAGPLIEDEPMFQLNLKGESGWVAVIELSDIKSITVLSVKRPLFGLFGDERAELEVVVFPNLMPKELIEKAMSYSELKERFTKTVSGWVNLRDKEGRKLSLVSREGGVYRVLAKLEDLEVKRKILFRYGFDGHDIWWAIESVIADDAYPYRLIPLR